MRRKILALMGVAAFVLALGVIAHAQSNANVAGTWEMTSEGRNGPQTSTLKITQDGATIKGTLTGGRGGDAPLEGTVSGNNITFTVTRAGRDGNEMKIEYKGTVDGDNMKGTVAFGQTSRDWSAKRSK